jgi:hypothetical protein
MARKLIETVRRFEDGSTARYAAFGTVDDPDNFDAIIIPDPNGPALDTLRQALAPGWEAFARSRPVPLVDPLMGEVHLGCYIDRDGMRVEIYRRYRAGRVKTEGGMLHFMPEVTQLVMGMNPDA